MILAGPRWWKLRTIGTALLIPPLLHLVAIDRLARRLVRRRPRPAGAPPPERIADWVDYLLGRLPWPWRVTCLKRAAVLFALLRRAGLNVELWIGVRRDQHQKLAAHAWLMRDGVPYLEASHEHTEVFQVILRLPEPEARAA